MTPCIETVSMSLRSVRIIAILCLLASSAVIPAAATRKLNTPLGSNATLPFAGVIDTNSTKIEWRVGHLFIFTADSTEPGYTVDLFGQLTIYGIQFKQAGEYKAWFVDRITGDHVSEEAAETVTVRVVEAPRCALLLSTSDANMSQLTCAVQFSAPDLNDVPNVSWLDGDGNCSWTDSSTVSNTHQTDGLVYATRTTTSVCRLDASVLTRGRLPVCRVTFGEDSTHNCKVESCPGGSTDSRITAAVPAETVDATNSSPSSSSSSTVERIASTEDIVGLLAWLRSKQEDINDSVAHAQPLHPFFIISQCVIIGLLLLIVIFLMLMCGRNRRPPYEPVATSETRDQSACENHYSTTSPV